MEALLTGNEVCAWLRVDRSTLRELCARRAIEYQVVGKRKRFSPRAVEAYLASRTVRAVTLERGPQRGGRAHTELPVGRPS